MRLLAETLRTPLVIRANGSASNVIPFLANREKLGRYKGRSAHLAALQALGAPELERPAQTDINTGRLERCACPGAALEEEKGRALALVQLAWEDTKRTQADRPAREFVWIG